MINTNPSYEEDIRLSLSQSAYGIQLDLIRSNSPTWNLRYRQARSRTHVTESHIPRASTA